jgi:hypothetical protein
MVFQEPDSVRIARIEEGMVALHGKIDRNHAETMKQMTPLVARQSKHHDWLIVLRRDRWWLFTLAGLAVSVACYAKWGGH